MTTHFWSSVEVKLNDDVVKPGTAIFARLSGDGNKPWQLWGCTKTATFLKAEDKVVLPSLIYGDGMDPKVHVSVHIARLGKNPSVKEWDLGEGTITNFNSGLNFATLKSSSGATIGTAFVTSESFKGKYGSTRDKEFLSFTAMAAKLDRMDSGIGAKSDPYFIMTTKVEDQKLFLYKSQFQKKTVSPNWGTVILPKGALGGFDENQLLDFEVWDWDKDTEKGGDDLIGTFSVSMADILAKKHVPVINAVKKGKKSSYTDSGTFMFADSEILTFDPNVYDMYIADKLTFKLNIVGSLGKPDESKEKEFYGIGSSISTVYDYAKEYHKAYQSDTCLYGFLSSNPAKRLPDENTLFGAIGTYPEQAFETQNKTHQSLSPHTKLSHTINACIVKAMQDREANPIAYNVFFIFVYDKIEDLDDCLSSLANSSNHPCSFVFVGLGDPTKCDWKSFEQFNPSSFGLASSERWACRDNVSFFPINASDYSLAPVVASARIIAQVREYSLARDIKGKGSMINFKPLLA